MTTLENRPNTALLVVDVQLPFVSCGIVGKPHVGMPGIKRGLRLRRQARGQQRRQPKLPDATECLSVLIFHVSFCYYWVSVCITARTVKVSERRAPHPARIERVVFTPGRRPALQ